MKKYFIGADVSKKTLDCVIYDDNSLKMKESHIKITNDREGRDELVKWMKGLGVTVNDAIVCMEYNGIYSYSFAELLAKKKIDFTMIPPLKIKGAFAGARGKNDKVDAMRIATYANCYKDEIKPMSLKDDKIVELRNLMNDRKMAVNLSAFTCNFSAFDDPRKFASYAGVSPFEYTSSTSVNRGTHVSKMANVMLKAEGKSYGCVINAVKF